MADKRTLPHRSVTERWIIKGKLILETPAHFGNGDADALTDMPLLVDEVHGKPLLPGTSIAGALRNYLRERELGFGEKESSDTLVSDLFGGYRSNDDGEQSPLIVFDAPGHSAGMELRDGVAIDPETRTAADEKKFDMQLLAAGSAFDLRFELAVNKNRESLLMALSTALQGLEDRQITLGARKRRGFGSVTVAGWQVWKFDLTTKEGLLNWLSCERAWKTHAPEQAGKTLVEKLGANVNDKDERKTARLSATFSIDGSLMIRSGFGQSDNGPDMVHLHSSRPQKGKPDEQEKLPVIPGTSWAGVLRQRALKIARTVSKDLQAENKKGEKLFKNKKANDKKIPLLTANVFIDGMFGSSDFEGENRKNAKASRVSIQESEIKDVDSLVITRVKIDRFTGGAYESALFNEQPAIGKPETTVTLEVSLRSPQDAEVGLLLLLLKDLWTGDLPIGGESGIGRGRLQGLNAMLESPKGKWEFKSDGEKVLVTPDAAQLETYVKVFNDEIRKAQVKHE